MKQTNKKTPYRPDTRGARNHNPLNIRIGNTWLGEHPNPTDSQFEQFVSDFYGLRAAMLILRRYFRRYGQNTIRKIINTWAPPVENATTMYVALVSKACALDPDEVFDFSDKEHVCLMVQEMARVESQLKISYDEVAKAYDAA